MQDEYNDIVLENDKPYVNDCVAENDSIVAASQNITEFSDGEANTKGKIKQVAFNMALVASLFAVTVAVGAPKPSAPASSVDGVEVTSFCYGKTLSVDFVISDEEEELKGFEVFIEDGSETKTPCSIYENEIENGYTATADLPDGTVPDGLTFVLSATTKEGWTGEICREALTLPRAPDVGEVGIEAWIYEDVSGNVLNAYFYVENVEAVQGYVVWFEDENGLKVICSVYTGSEDMGADCFAFCDVPTETVVDEYGRITLVLAVRTADGWEGEVYRDKVIVTEVAPPNEDGIAEY